MGPCFARPSPFPLCKERRPQIGMPSPLQGRTAMLTRPIPVSISLVCIAPSIMLAGCNPPQAPPPPSSEPVPAAAHHPSDPASKTTKNTPPPPSR